DAGGPVSPLIAAAERHDMTPTHVLLTHHHHDHVDELGKLTDRWPDLEVLSHPDERVDGVTGEMGPDETVTVGNLQVRTLATPSPPRWPRNGNATRSCASGAGWTPRATSRAPPWASRPRSSCSATTTTAATRRGCAGPTAPTTSSAARRSSRARGGRSLACPS